MVTRKHGWLRDKLDHRDLKFQLPEALPIHEPIDLRQHCPPVYDQGETSSCTGNMAAALVQYDMIKQGIPSVEPSRLMAYYDARLIEGTTKSDSGAQIRDAIKGIAKYGVCAETLWPFNPSKVTTKPTNACYVAARKYMAIKYGSLTQTKEALYNCLSTGLPFGFGFSVFEDFENSSWWSSGCSGVIQMPGKDEAPIGGHAVCCCGVDPAKDLWLIRNSWSSDWCPSMGGYFWMSSDYILDSNLADDFWVIQVIS